MPAVLCEAGRLPTSSARRPASPAPSSDGMHQLGRGAAAQQHQRSSRALKRRRHEPLGAAVRRPPLDGEGAECSCGLPQELYTTLTTGCGKLGRPSITARRPDGRDPSKSKLTARRHFDVSPRRTGCAAAGCRARSDRWVCHQPVDPLEVVEIGEVDGDPAPRASHGDLHLGVEVVAEHLFELQHAGWRQRALAPGSAGRRGRLARPLDRKRCLRHSRASRAARLGGAPPLRPGEPTAPHGRCARRAPPGSPGRAYRTRPGRDRRTTGGHATMRWIAGEQLEQAQRVGDRRTAPTDAGRKVLLGQPEVLDELLVGGRLFERVEILAVEVLDQRLFEADEVSDRPHDGRDRVEARPAWRPASAALLR